MNVYTNSQCMCEIVLILLFRKTCLLFDTQNGVDNLETTQCYKAFLVK